MNEKVKTFLDAKVEEYNQPDFIKNDPVGIPHLFTKRQDIEIAGLFAAVFAWGNRTTIIQKATEVMQLMKMQPHHFILNAVDEDLKTLLHFRHRTFNATDLLYFIEFLRSHYSQYESLENAFTDHGTSVREMLAGFHDQFFSLEDAPARTRKHISTPEKKSTCKRMNMFLRWMVRNDDRGVDFGLWQGIRQEDLIIPIDLHVARVARRIGLLRRKQTDWEAAEELTANLRKFDPSDPVRYDFALFTLGVAERF